MGDRKYVCRPLGDLVKKSPRRVTSVMGYV